MPDWKALLAQHGPKLVMGLLAAKQGGPQASAAFMEGLQESSARREQRTYAEQDRARQAQRETRADATQAAQLANMERDDARQERSFETQQFERAVRLMQEAGAHQAEFATDPGQAENAMMQQATSIATGLGMAPDRLTGFIPNMGPAITAGQKKRAKARYAEFVKAHGDKAAEREEALKDPSGEFMGKTFREVRDIAEALTPQPTVAKPPTVGSFEEYVNAPPERQAVIEGARKRYQQADDRPLASESPDAAEMRRLQIELAKGRLVDQQTPKEPEEPKQAQYLAAGYAGRMEQAEGQFRQLDDDIAGMNWASFETQVKLPPAGQSAKMQSYMQAARNFVNAVLRRESGAVISPSEFSEARQQYLAQPGDTPETLKQKADNRAYVFQTLKRAAGSAYEPPLSVPSKTGGSVRMRAPNGQEADVPADQVEAAMAKGASVVVK